MKIKQINLTNFLSFKTLLLDDLDKYKTFALLGENGAGKSSILEAFLYNLYNISMRGNLDTLVHFNCGNMETDFIYINGDNTLRIVRGLKKAGQKYQSYLKVFLNNKDISMDTSGVTQEGIIKKFIHVSQNMFLKSHLFKANILETDSGNKLNITDLIEELFNMKELDIALEKSTNYRLLMDRSFKRGLEHLKTYIAYKHNLQNVQQKNIEDINSEIQNNKNIIQQQKKVKEDLVIKKDSLQKVLKQDNDTLNALKKEITQKQEQIYNIDMKISGIHSQIESNSKINNIEVCPTCKQKVSSEHKEKIKKYIDSLIEKKNEFTTEKIKIKKVLEEKELYYHNLENDFKQHGKDLDSLEHNIIFQEKSIKELEEKNKQLENKIKNIKETEIGNQMVEISKKIYNILGAMTHTSFFYSYFDKMVSILSEGSEFRYFFMNLDGFNTIIQQYSGFFEIPFQIKFVSNNKSKIVPVIIPYSNKNIELSFSQVSSGQKRKIILILLMSIITFLLKDKRHLKILFFDEVLDNLDQNGVSSVLSYINTLKQKEDIQTFFISHSHIQEILPIFDKIFWVSLNPMGVSEIKEM